MLSRDRSVHTLPQMPHQVDIATVPVRRVHSVASAVGQTGSVFQRAYIPPSPLMSSETQSNQRYGVAVGDVLACHGTPGEWAQVDPRTLGPHRRARLRAETQTLP